MNLYYLLIKLGTHSLHVLILFIPSLDLPNPVVITTATGNEMAGEPYNLTCSVTVVDRLIVSPEIEWMKGSVGIFNKNNDSSVDPLLYEDQLVLSFDFLNTSDAEEYVCIATVTISEINIFAIESSVEVINLQSEFYSGYATFILLKGGL